MNFMQNAQIEYSTLLLVLPQVPAKQASNKNYTSVLLCVCVCVSTNVYLTLTH